jgi:hypothetical protein
MSKVERNNELAARRRKLSWIGAAIVLLAIAVRFYFFFIQDGMHHPDEFFQYLEPAHWRLTGSGWLPWEYERGARNWLLPGIFGSWMAIFRRFGLASIELREAIWVMNIGLSLFILPAGFRLGKSLGQSAYAGLFVSFLFASFPVLAWFAPRTLSENLCMLSLVWGVTLWIEDSETMRSGDARSARAQFLRPIAIGALLGLAVSFRYTTLILLPVVWCDYNFRSRFRDLFLVVAGSLAPILFVGVLDIVTWGDFLHSFREFVEYNLIENGNENHGVMATHFYWSTALHERLGFAAYLILAMLFASGRRCWRLLLLVAVFIAVHSLIGHKEERFLLPIWPLFVAAVGIGIWRVTEWSRSMSIRPLVPYAMCASLCLALLVPAYFGVHKGRMEYLADLIHAQAWVGSQPDVTGVVVDGPKGLDGGYFHFAANAPQSTFRSEILGHDLFNYVILYEHMEEQPLPEDQFSEVKKIGDAHIFKLHESHE